MFTLNIKKSSLFALSVLMIGCGGGGGGGGSSAGADSNATDDNASTAIPAITITNASGDAVSTQIKMQELVAAPDFLFTSKQAVQVTFSLSDYELQRAYVSVYSDYQQLSSGRFYPNANSRTVAGDLKQGEFDSTFVSLSNQSAYLVEVWLYDGQDALQKELTVSNNKLVW